MEPRKRFTRTADSPRTIRDEALVATMTGSGTATLTPTPTSVLAKSISTTTSVFRNTPTLAYTSPSSSSGPLMPVAQEPSAPVVALVVMLSLGGAVGLTLLFYLLVSNLRDEARLHATTTADIECDPVEKWELDEQSLDLIAPAWTPTEGALSDDPSISSPPRELAPTDLESSTCSICLESLLSLPHTETDVEPHSSPPLLLRTLPRCRHTFHSTCLATYISHNASNKVNLIPVVRSDSGSSLETAVEVDSSPPAATATATARRPVGVVCPLCRDEIAVFEERERARAP